MIAEPDLSAMAAESLEHFGVRRINGVIVTLSGVINNVTRAYDVLVLLLLLFCCQFLWHKLSG